MAEGKRPSGLARLYHWVSGNAVQIEAGAAAKRLREISPTLLQPGEEVEMAFKVEYQHFYFTTKRVLFRYKQGITGTSVLYNSLPYSTIQAFAVSTAGSWDSDTELTLWSQGQGETTMDFVAGSVDMFAIQRLFNAKLLRPDAGPVREPGNENENFSAGAAGEAESKKTESVFDVLFDDARQIEPSAVEALLKSSPPILEPDEKVEMAFRCGRDSTLFTSKRIVFVDVKGITGKRVRYLSVLWSSIRAFSVETAGGVFDRDAEVRLFTKIKDLRCVGQDLRKGKADVVAVQRYISNMVLGVDTAPPAAEASSAAGLKDAGPTGFWEYIGDDGRQVDAEEADRQFHTAPAVLQGCEKVEMAFKGRRDMMLFTTKRLVKVDMKGWSGKKVKYLSLPWGNVKAWGVRSAGAYLDKDSEMMIWTDIMHEPKVGDDPPEPGMSYFEQDFRKDKVDLMVIHRYLSEKCLGAAEDHAPPPISAQALKQEPPSALEGALNWLGQDMSQISAESLDEQLHGTARILQQDEKVVMAFKVGRDTHCFTNKRVFMIDVQGFSGKKVEYKSVPYSSLRAFSVETAGSWDRDTEVKLYPKAYWMPVIHQDFRKGKADVMAIQNFLSQKLFAKDHFEGNAQPVHYSATEAPSASGLVAWLGENMRAVDPKEVDKQLHDAHILLPDEAAESAFKVGRDTLVFTTKRILQIDVQGITGTKIEYKSMPLKYCRSWAVKSAGMLDVDAESSIWTDAPGWNRVAVDLRKGGVDIFAYESAIAAKFLKTG